MIHQIVLLAATTFLMLTGALWAQGSVEKPLPVDGHIALNGRAVELSWFEAIPPRVGTVTVNRRLYGQTGGASWRPVSPVLGPVLRFTDDRVQVGQAYEYQILRRARDIVDVGYWLTGVDIPARETRGTAYVVVDQTIAEDIAPRLARFQRDLTGDGWRVLRHTVPRGGTTTSRATLQTAQSIKVWLRQQYLSDPFGQHAVILVGHVPVVTSGRANPDGHKPAPHATDLFYVEMDGLWRATSQGQLLNTQLPSDFIEMQIGRIDFSNISRGKREKEIRFLQAYFDKNHHWRRGLLGDLRGAYGGGGGLVVEQYGLKNIVGHRHFTSGGHHDVGEVRPWLWGVDFGDASGANYLEKHTNKAVFTLNFGSNKQRFEAFDNAMTAALAQPWYTIAVGWGARPSWWLHPMALGATIGEAHMRTVNNGRAAEPYRESMDYYPTGQYLWRNPIWVNLLGDPTTRAFPLAPPLDVRARQTDQGVSLFWRASSDPDVIGYKLYRAQAGSMEFTPLNDGAVLDALTFTDPVPEPGARYMVRAYGLKDVYAGSFYTLSQGAFADVGISADIETVLQISTPVATTVALPEVFDKVQDAQIYAIVEGPDTGQLEHDGTSWLFTSATGFTGDVNIRFSVSDILKTHHGRLRITVVD